MARKFQNVSGKDQVFSIFDQELRPGQFWAPERKVVTVPKDGIVEGNYWERYATPGGVLKELLDSKSDSSSSPDA